MKTYTTRRDNRCESSNQRVLLQMRNPFYKKSKPKCSYPFDLFAQTFIFHDYFLQSFSFRFKLRSQLSFTLTLEFFVVSLEKKENKNKLAVSCSNRTDVYKFDMSRLTFSLVFSCSKAATLSWFAGVLDFFSVSFSLCTLSTTFFINPMVFSSSGTVLPLWPAWWGKHHRSFSGLHLEQVWFHYQGQTSVELLLFLCYLILIRLDVFHLIYIMR